MSSNPVSRVLVALVMLAAAAMAVTKKPPDFSGKWILNREESTADPRFLKDDSMVVTQKGDEVKFAYYAGDKPDGIETIVVDGIDHKRYFTRIERAYARARWGPDELVVTTKHVLDLFGYQSYNETDRWVLSANRRTLVNELSDGKKIVWDWDGPPPGDPLADVQDFRAVGISSGKASAASRCRLELEGGLKGEKIGAGKFRVCMNEAPDPPQQAAEVNPPPPRGGCTPLGGTLHFASDDGVSALALSVSGQYCPGKQSFLGTYNVDPSSVVGKFSDHVKGGSGMIQFSGDTNAVVLNGALLYR